ncbi:ABC-2 type transporter [Candidatus Sulfotelmatobacter kueseliae]|uniref:Transport permease protein n=1 Tax=Candidatus Sulfotelmatobacter kueseliae TaxID=2042962 RepID=A0A2U3KFF7_9BACT|nr:ABC-2 type transporter [Candidatus Sulfotelmatobacter kueseliae]
MNLTRLRAIAAKEVRQILRDARSLIIVILMPVVLVLLFGYGVSLDLKHLPVYVYDRDGSQQSQDLLKHFQSNQYFHVVQVVDSYPALVRAIDDGSAKMGLVIPWDFSQRLRDGRPVSVQALIDATDDNTANVLISYSQAVVQGFSSEIQVDWLQRRGLPAQPAPISVEARTWYNEDLESSAFIIPGVLALVMSVIGAFLTSLTIAREWERGTMEQLVSTPVTPLEIMLGKLFPYFVIGMFDVMLSAGIALYWFRVPFRGSFGVLLLASALFMIVVLALGFFISVIAKNQFAASQIALLITFLPAFLLSGFLFAIEQMPIALQYFTRILPVRYYVAILKKIFLKGSPIPLLYTELVPLAVFAVVLAFLATHSFHKRLA